MTSPANTSHLALLVDDTEPVVSRIVQDLRPASLAASVEARRTGKPRPKRVAPAETEVAPYQVKLRGQRYWMSGTNPVTGERFRKPCAPEGQTSGAKIKEEAHAIARDYWQRLNKKARDVALGVDVRQDISTAALVPQYVEHTLSDDVSIQYKEDVVRCMERLMEMTTLGKVQRVDDIKRPFVQHVADELMELRVAARGSFGKGTVPFTPTMKRNHLLKLSAFCTWCVDRGYMESNPVLKHKALQYTKSERPSDHFYDYPEMARLIATARLDRVTMVTVGNFEVFMTQTHTGARIDEVHRIQPSDVDLKTGYITIRGARKGKNRHLKEIPLRRIRMSQPLIDVLLAYFANHRPHNWPLLFPHASFINQPGRGKCRKRRTSYKWLRGLCERAGVDYKSGTHVFRHTFASVRLRMMMPVAAPNGQTQWAPVPPEQVRTELGHSLSGEVDTLRKVYAKALEMPRIAMTELDYEKAAA